MNSFSTDFISLIQYYVLYPLTVIGGISFGIAIGYTILTRNKPKAEQKTLPAYYAQLGKTLWDCFKKTIKSYFWV